MVQGQYSFAPSTGLQSNLYSAISALTNLVAGFAAADILDFGASVPVEPVVIAELGACADRLLGKDAHAQLACHEPLLRDAVGLAGVVDEARHAPLHSRIDDLLLPAVNVAGVSSQSLASSMRVSRSLFVDAAH